jgi:hypothetical protein
MEIVNMQNFLNELVIDSPSLGRRKIAQPLRYSHGGRAKQVTNEIPVDYPGGGGGGGYERWIIL